MEQRSPEWFAARCGRITCSRLIDVIRGSNSYLAQLRREQNTGEVSQVSTAALQWGINNEQAALSAYWFETGLDVEKVGLITDPERDYFRGSPDGLVGDKGLNETKCPFNEELQPTRAVFHTYGGTIIDEEYMYQIQGLLHITRRDWCDFVSFDPRYTKVNILIERIYRDEVIIKKLVRAVDLFWVRIFETEQQKTIPSLF